MKTSKICFETIPEKNLIIGDPQGVKKGGRTPPKRRKVWWADPSPAERTGVVGDTQRTTATRKGEEWRAIPKGGIKGGRHHEREKLWAIPRVGQK